MVAYINTHRTFVRNAANDLFEPDVFGAEECRNDRYSHFTSAMMIAARVSYALPIVVVEGRRNHVESVFM